MFFIRCSMFLFSFPYRSLLSLALTLIGILIVAALILPAGKKELDPIQGKIEPFDERDVIFSRWRYEPGTDIYEKYYHMHPDLQSLDDDIRRRPKLFSPGGSFYEPLLARLGRAEFGLLEVANITILPSFKEGLNL